jgi:hypothetical protein
MYYFLTNSENSTSSQGQEAESSVEFFSDIPAFVLSRSNPIAERFSSNGSGMESCHASQSGTMSGLSTGSRGEEGLTQSVRASRASVFPQPEREVGSSTKTITLPSSESFAKWDRGSCSWKIPRFLLAADCGDFCGTWPNWGLMLDGECWVQTAPDFRINESASGFSLPTPSGVNGGKNHTMGRIDEWGGSSNPLRGTVLGYLCLPEFEEMVMGWPIGWTALTPLGTDKFQQWCASHGMSFQPLAEVSAQKSE